MPFIIFLAHFFHVIIFVILYNTFKVLYCIHNKIITNHATMRGNAITSIRMIPHYLSNLLTFGLDLLHVCGSLPWLAGGLKLNVTGHGQDAVSLTLVLDRGQFSSMTAPGISRGASVYL